MKLQYLGDSKDCFKWDYLNFLMSKLGYPVLNVVPMMTSQDGGSHGRTKADEFKNPKKEILCLCSELNKIKKSRQKKITGDNKRAIQKFIDSVKCLPRRMSLSYRVEFHKAEEFITANNRQSYFEGFDNTWKQIVFVDPDTGFEPKECSREHIKYVELVQILEAISDDSIVLVFQNFRRKNFEKDFKEIAKRITEEARTTASPTAVYWDGKVMFVSIAKSESLRKRLIRVNGEYANQREQVWQIPEDCDSGSSASRRG